MVIPTFESQRLRLEPLTHSHSKGMFELWREAAVCQYVGPSSDSRGRPVRLPAQSQRESDRLLDYWLDRRQDGTGFRWAVVLAAQPEFVGAVGFNALGSRSEYAYHFVPRHWGAGLATEASRFALAWSFSSGSQFVEAFIEAANARSIRLAERLGFEMVERPPGRPIRYVLSRADYSAERSRGAGVE